MPPLKLRPNPKDDGSAPNGQSPPTEQPTLEVAAPVEPKPAAAPVSSDDLTRVREILVGAQMRGVEHRFSAFEEKLSRELSQMHAQMREEIRALERVVKNEVNAVSERMSAEQHDRREGSQKLHQEMEALGHELDKKLGSLDMRTNKAQRDLREQLLAQSNLLSDTMKQRHEEMSAALAEGLASVRSASANRSKLAGLLKNVAEQIDREESDAR